MYSLNKKSIERINYMLFKKYQPYLIKLNYKLHFTSIQKVLDKWTKN